MAVLVDTSVWIDYFKEGKSSTGLDYLIDENLVVINDIILAELIPFLMIKRHSKVIKRLHQINKVPLQINWAELIESKVRCLKAGINGVGIPGLIIAQNAIDNDLCIYSLDKHFRLISRVLSLEIYDAPMNLL